jgi:hypothetical protein
MGWVSAHPFLESDMKRIFLVLLVCSTSYGALVAHWKLDENAASATVSDETGNHDGTYKDGSGNINTSTGASTGHIDGALDFDGGDEYVDVTDHADFTPALSAFSISAWCYMDSVTNFYIASKGTYNTNGEWVFYSGASDTLIFLLMDEDADNCYIGRTYSTGITAYEGTWIHVVATYDGGTTSAAAKIYLNGARVDNANAENLPVAFLSVRDGNANVYVGRYTTVYGNGRIDDLRIYSEELAQSQIDALYRGTATGHRIRYRDGYRYTYRNRYNY